MRGARVHHLIGVGLVLVLALIGRLWFLQVLHGDTWAEEAEFSRMDLRMLPFKRGRILDRDGRVLAEDRIALELQANYRDFRRDHPVGQILEALQLLGEPDLGLPAVAQAAERHAARLLALRPQDLKRYAADDVTDLRYYLRALCGLPESLARPVQEWAAAPAGPSFADAFPGARAAAQARIAAARTADARLDAELGEAASAAGEPPALPLLAELEEERQRLQRRIRWLALRAALDRAFPEQEPGAPARLLREGGPEAAEVLAALQQRWRPGLDDAALAALLRGEGGTAAELDAARQALLPRIGAAAPGDVAGLRRELVRVVHGDTTLRLRRDIPYTVAELLVRDAADYPGLYVQEMPDRVYPGEIAPHLVGGLSSMDQEAVERYLAARREFQELSRAFYRSEEDEARFRALQHGFLAHALQPGDRVGSSGVEATYEAVLRGERGYQRVLHGAEEGTRARELVYQPPRHGEDVVLTLDVPLQQEAEAALRAAYAAARQALQPDDKRWRDDPELYREVLAGLEQPRAGFVLLDLRDGSLPVLATLPTYRRDGILPDYQTFAARPDRPLRHRGLAGNFQAAATPYPGSTFKLLAAALLLEQDPIGGLSRTYYCEGRLDAPGGARPLHCETIHHRIALHEAVQESCNVYFYELGRDLGYEAIHDYARRLGFGGPTGIELVEVRPGKDGGWVAGGESRMLEHRANVLLPPLDENGRPKSIRDTMRLAIGQTCVTASPLQMARFYAWLATGVLPTPRLVREGGGASPAAPPSDAPTLNPVHQRMLNGALADVVRHGTAEDAERPLEEFDVVGKTGTAQIDDGIPVHAWFAGYFPADNPRYAFAVYCENAGLHGGELASDALYEFLKAVEEKGLGDNDEGTRL